MSKKVLITHFSFTHIVLPCDDNRLRDTTLDRLGFSCPKYEKLPLDIEHALVDIISKELVLNQNLEIIKNKLRQRYDYSTQSVFKAVDSRNQNYLGMYSISEFLGKTGFRPTERECVAILRRLDVEGNGKITFTDFAEFLHDGQDSFKDQSNLAS